MCLLRQCAERYQRVWSLLMKSSELPTSKIFTNVEQWECREPLAREREHTCTHEGLFIAPFAHEISLISPLLNQHYIASHVVAQKVFFWNVESVKTEEISSSILRTRIEGNLNVENVVIYSKLVTKRWYVHCILNVFFLSVRMGWV